MWVSLIRFLFMVGMTRRWLGKFHVVGNAVSLSFFGMLIHAVGRNYKCSFGRLVLDLAVLPYYKKQNHID